MNVAGQRRGVVDPALSILAFMSLLAYRTAKSSTLDISRVYFSQNCSFHLRHWYRRHYATGSNVSAAETHNSDVYCRDFVRQHDRDAYLTSHFFSKELQRACFAIRAFYVCDILALYPLTTDTLSPVGTSNDPRLCVKPVDWTNAFAVLERCYQATSKCQFFCILRIMQKEFMSLTISGNASQTSNRFSSSRSGNIFSYRAIPFKAHCGRPSMSGHRIDLVLF